MAPRRQDRKEKYFPISPNLASFAARPVEYPFHRSVIFSFTALFHGASPVEYRLDHDRVVRPKHYSTGQVLVYPIP